MRLIGGTPVHRINRITLINHVISASHRTIGRSCIVAHTGIATLALVADGEAAGN